MTIKIIINGHQGKMGKTLVTAMASQPELQVVAATGSQDNLAQAIVTYRPDVVVDFTTPHSVYANIKTIIAHRVRPIIGTTGLTIEQIKELQQECQQKSLGGIIAPNFSLSAVLMMRYAQDAAKYFPNMEIVELHNPHKLDAPSGTAKKTAEMMAGARKKVSQNPGPLPPARGEQYQNIPIHSVRLPGFFSHQVVIFGGEGEILTIRHDGMDRNAMMPGVFLACHKAMTLNHLVYGLENIL